MILRAFRVALVSCLAFVASDARSQDAAPELTFRNERLHVLYQIAPGGARTETREMHIKALNRQALERLKQASVSYSTSVEKAEVLEAYTRKPDGKRIDVPKSNYQMDINKGGEGGAPAFSDRTTMSVIFPDAAVGDTFVLKYRITESEPMFPGHFSVTDWFGKQWAFDDVKIRVEAPADLWTQHGATAMTETVNETRDGRKVVEWTWKNPDPRRVKRRDFSAFQPEKEPGYSFSTFRSYQELAEAYWKRARPIAQPTERTRKLADEITTGTTDPKAQVKALYEWVATNVHYAGNCVGVGAVVPREQAFVLDNRMGDCKDHATLLQALLASKGIASTQALVNSGRTYRLPKVPVISMVNHVILYVPSLDLFLDSTSDDTPFGMLPMGDSDKPVLLVDGYKDGLRTPPMSWEKTRHVTRTEATVKPDGTIEGTVTVTTAGMFAVQGRSRMRNVTSEDREELLKRMYEGTRKTGYGKLSGDDPKPLAETYNYAVKMAYEDFASLPGPGAFSVYPLFPTVASVGMVAGNIEEEPEAEETSCVGGTIVDEYVLKLPPTIKVIAMPKNVTAQGGSATYRSTYSMKGNVVTVKRELVDKTSRNLCPVKLQHDFVPLARKISADLKSQFVYR